MHALRNVIGVVWILFWVSWLLAARSAKEGRASRRRIPLNAVTVVAVLVLLRVFRGGSLTVESPVLGAIGAVVFGCGIALALWARVNLGRNWGMPMSQKAEPELVTSGPYRFVRHPIYSGLLTAVLGTALVTSLIGLIIVALMGGYFYYSALIEERNLTATFPAAYPEYRRHTKMLIPFVL